MTMVFRQVKKSLIDNIIGPAAAGRFRLTGFQNQANDASEVLDNNRLVQVYFKQGTFSKTSGRRTGPIQHSMIFQIDLTVSTGFVGDVSVINNPASTPAEIVVALAAFQEATDKADESIDELFDILYQIIMDGRNIDLGLDENVIGERWLSELQKDQPIERGEYAVLTGSMQLTVSSGETVDGDIGVPADTIQSTIDLDGDTAKTGVTTDLTPEPEPEPPPELTLLMEDTPPGGSPPIGRVTDVGGKIWTSGTEGGYMTVPMGSGWRSATATIKWPTEVADYGNMYFVLGDEALNHSVIVVLQNIPSGSTFYASCADAGIDSADNAFAALDGEVRIDVDMDANTLIITGVDSVQFDITGWSPTEDNMFIQRHVDFSGSVLLANIHHIASYGTPSP